MTNGAAPVSVTVHGPDVVAISGQALAVTDEKGSPIRRLAGVGIAVQGVSDAGQGVVAQSTTGVALTASSQSGTAVVATSAATDGVHGIGKNGIHGDSASPTDSGVWGNNTGGGHGVTGSTGAAGAGYGVYGISSASDGVHGVCNSDASGVAGISDKGTGIYGRGGKNAGVFDGSVQVNGSLAAQALTGDKGNALAVNSSVQVTGNVTVTGTLTADTDIVLGADCAEEFDVACAVEAEPGTVMVINHDGALEPSRRAYDKMVAGVISGAGDYKPGLILGKTDGHDGRALIALVGKVYCKVSARNGPIGIGDMLTTSPVMGHAMKATDERQAFGSVIGKALRSLEEGESVIPILVALQ